MRVSTRWGTSFGLVINQLEEADERSLCTIIIDNNTFNLYEY